MSNAVFAALAKARPRETMGSAISARYDFQAHVSILKLIELRESGEDFCAFFDYHDDLVILDSATDPTSARFFQIKAKGSGKWTVPGFCKRDGEEAPKSIISRMYSNVDSFTALVDAIGFISNAPFNVKLIDGTQCGESSTLIEGTSLHPTAVAALEMAIKEDYEEPLHSEWPTKLLLERVSLGVNEQEVFVRGRLLDYVAGLEIAHQVPIAALYNVMFNAIRVKIGNIDESGKIESLLSAKALSSVDLQSLFDKASTKTPSFLADWDLIEGDLRTSNVGSAQIIRLRTKAIVYMRRLKLGAPVETTFSNVARSAAREARQALQACRTILEARDILGQLLVELNSGLAGVDLDAALLVEAHGAIYESAE